MFDDVNVSNITPLTFPINPHLMVQGLISEGTKRWDEAAIRSNLCHDDVAKVLQTPLLDSIKENLFCWLDTRCMFIVKSIYKLAINNLIYCSSLNVIGDWSLV